MFSVLVCDDSLVARKQVAKCLPQDWEVAVHFAKNGQDALSALAEGKGDLLLLDLNMPVLDGYGTLEAIQKQGLKTKVIVVSGDIQPEAHERVTSLGALDFIRKPVDPKKLAEVLDKFNILHVEEEEPEEEVVAEEKPKPKRTPRKRTAKKDEPKATTE